jgi:hypothetical protein
LPVLAIFGKSHGDQTRRLSQGESVSAVPILLFARGNGQAFPIDSGRVATGAHVPQRREPLWHGAASENYLSSGLCARPAAAKPSGKRGSADTINEVYGCESTSDFSANGPDNWRSCDEPPTRILYVPGSASQRCLVVGVWGATEQLWNAFHNCSVAPLYPNTQDASGFYGPQ